MISWLKSIWTWFLNIFRKPAAAAAAPKKLWHGHEWKRLVGEGRSPGKEDAHTKIRRKMADKSRKINRSKKNTKGH